ncbi:hypothetical protein quinque_006555 [Culex quinquefasciatus]
MMEAASGGYIEVGRVLLDKKGAYVNVAPVHSSRDTALTIAAHKGHLKFVELLLSCGAAVEVKNKKGKSTLWLAANGGHLAVVEVLCNAGEYIDPQDKSQRQRSELLEKCHDCVKVIRAAKGQQATNANINASILFKELDLE